MQKRFQSIPVILVVAAAVLFSVACGGGGGGNSGPNIPVITAPAAGTMASLDQDHGESIVALSMFGQEVSNVSGLSSIFVGLSADSEPAQPSTSLAWTVIDFIKAELSAAELDYQAAASRSDDLACSSGSASVDMTWTGPEQGTCHQIVDLSGHIAFKNCSFQGAALAGTIDVSFTGPLCRPTAISMVFTNFVMAMGQESMSTRSLEMDITNITWSGEMTSGGYMTNARTITNGDAIGRSDGVKYAAVLDGFTQIVSTLDDMNLTIDISGNIYGKCLDGWAAVETITPIQVNTAADCPTAGEVRITGQNQATMDVVFSPSVVTIDGLPYPSCTALNLGCPLL